MSESKYTFWKLINEFNITIPIIQRDYAQGRKTEKINDIRKKLIDDIFNSFKHENNKLVFDFIYGSIREIDKKKYLIPLDGQQRLTTLFLLHWYLSSKEGSIEDRKLLNRFSYETRISSKEFCNALIDNQMNFNDIGSGHCLSEYIQNCPWFYRSWNKDPTIKSMLVMLDEIHNKFQNSDNYFTELKDESKSLD